MDRVSSARMAGGTTAASTSSNTAGRLPVKPAVAFKQAMARAMDGWGADAPAAALQPRAVATPQSARTRAVAVADSAATATSRTAGSASSSLPAAFRQRIAVAESSAATRPDQGYGARNAASGALGRYQMMPVALRDIGWQDASGGWTSLAAGQGVASEAEFLGSPAAQEAAMAAYIHRAETQLNRNGSLARSGGSVTGLDGGAVPLTDAGLVAAAHRSGANSVARYLAFVGGEASPATLSAADRRVFTAVERRLRDFADTPYQIAVRRAPRDA